ncbi:MAG: hypothetical protein J0H84_24580 [Rhizobiales bacterium]|jgi:hypothetical protein|nr:hypothetical protein [Hyphomicrobiales bacterium]
MRTLLYIAGLLVIAMIAMPRNAVTSEWGCEVLLCASSSNPSWHGIAECHPPMERLIEAMSHPGFSWPTCPEGGAGKPGYEQYADCPEGWAPTSKSELGHGGLALSYCIRRGDSCGSNQWFKSHSDNGTCSETEYMARPVRSDPYYVDITDATEGLVSRHWFNLAR